MSETQRLCFGYGIMMNMPALIVQRDNSVSEAEKSLERSSKCIKRIEKFTSQSGRRVC